MRTTFRIFAAAAVTAIGILTSCQKQELDMQETDVLAGKELVPITLNVSITGTRVTYTETAEKHLQPDWVEGDKVIGFDGDGNPYEFIISSTAADGTAKLTGEAPANCTLHLIYLGSATPAVTKGLSLPINVDYTAQAGTQETMPAVMLSDGEVSKGTGKFTFRNAGAIIGIRAMKGVPSGKAISKITVEGENLSTATVALSGSALALTATEKTGDAISTATLTGITTIDADGTLSSPIFIAVPAGAKIAKVSTNPIQTREPETMKIPSTAPDKEGIDYVTIAGKKWAKWNVGANNEKEYGWYFPWGGTEGYVRKDSKWVSASGVDTYTYTLSSVKTVSSSEYLYVKTQSFAAAGHSFDWAHTPYQTQNTTSGSSIKFTKYLGSTTSSYKDPSATDEDALKTVLDPEDDAATVNWGGGWRMPTHDEFEELVYATYWAWDETDKGCYVYAPCTATDAGKFNHGTGYYNKYYNALLFFPSAGYGGGTGTEFRRAGERSYCWSNTLWSPEQAWYLFHQYDDVVVHDYTDLRYAGFSVRPIADIDTINAGTQDYNSQEL